MRIPWTEKNEVESRRKQRGEKALQRGLGLVEVREGPIRVKRREMLVGERHLIARGGKRVVEVEAVREKGERGELRGRYQLQLASLSSSSLFSPCLDLVPPSRCTLPPKGASSLTTLPSETGLRPHLLVVRPTTETRANLTGGAQETTGTTTTDDQETGIAPTIVMYDEGTASERGTGRSENQTVGRRRAQPIIIRPPLPPPPGSHQRTDTLGTSLPHITPHLRLLVYLLRGQSLPLLLPRPSFLQDPTPTSRLVRLRPLQLRMSSQRRTSSRRRRNV